jgi:hypothetical protein
MANVKITQLPGLSVLNDTGQFPVVSGNVTYNVTANVMQTFMANVPGPITVNSSNQSVAIINGGGNGVGNIGSASTYFNVVFAKATSAQYADLAEIYVSDAPYGPGTVVMLGGSAEITQCDQDMCSAVAGVVSTQPAYLMNSGLTGENAISVALVGRVPCAVQGKIKKGDLLVSAGNGQSLSESNPKPGTIIGKAIESFEGDTGTIEILVGKA